jgi:hypothetical protein
MHTDINVSYDNDKKFHGKAYIPQLALWKMYAQGTLAADI